MEFPRPHVLLLRFLEAVTTEHLNFNHCPTGDKARKIGNSFKTFANSFFLKLKEVFDYLYLDIFKIVYTGREGATSETHASKIKLDLSICRRRADILPTTASRILSPPLCG